VLQRYGVQGFPTVLFLTPDGEVLGALGDRSPQAVRQQILTAKKLAGGG
jgi:hypothetical protein